MKIAMMTNNYKPFVGGVPVSVERLTEGLRERGHEVCVFAPEYKGYEDVYGEDVVRYHSSNRKLKNGMAFPGIWDSRLKEEFEWREFDLIHVHHPMLIGNVAVHLSRTYQIPLVYTYHTRYEEYLHYIDWFSSKGYGRQKCMKVCKRLLPYYMNSYMRKCDLVLAPSVGMRKYIESQEVETPVRVLPTGLDDSAYKEEKEKSGEIRNQILSEKKYLFCTMSRLEKEKNLYFLLRCIQSLKKRMGEEFRFMIVGGGDERNELETYARELGIEEVTVFVGEVPNQEVKHYLFASDSFLFASKSETQGIVLSEAMAAGLPVVAVSACGVDDIVKNGRNGFLTEEKEEEFASRIEELVQNKVKYEKMKEEARKTAWNYQMSYITTGAETYYRMLLERERSVVKYENETCKKKNPVSSVLHLFKAS